uniref:Uncharacterized protein LOC111106037 n=1 Tax=Crassostrea virginica TaxID=6565 RepID=A0A8B8AYM5_CRAVI|nr:uncharacterized protein LOC111106037 [Crassostrea virginica]
MALSKLVDGLDEVDIKVHYTYYNENRVTPISIEFNELTSLGYIGLEAVIQSQIKYIGRMSVVRIAYKDKEGDYVDLTYNNYNIFLRTVGSADDDTPVINVRVTEGTSPGHYVQKSASEPIPGRESFIPARKELTFAPPEVQCKSSLDGNSGEILQCSPRAFGNGKQCGNCHLRLDHTSRQCRIEKCLTSQQCGDVSKHPEEKSILESASEHLKKLEKQLREKTLDLEMKQKAANSVKNSFTQRVRGYLINSNKDKYLLRTSDGKFVPRSGIVNTDIAKLEKYFNGKIPTDIAQAASTFQTIISTFDTTAGLRNRHQNPARHLLEQHAVRFPPTAALGRPPERQIDNRIDDHDDDLPPKKRQSLQTLMRSDQEMFM